MDYLRRYENLKKEFKIEHEGKISHGDLISVSDLESIADSLHSARSKKFKLEDYSEKERFNIWANDSGFPVIYVAILMKHKEDKKYAIDVVRARGW